MQKILGIDLGVASIGWAYIAESADNEVLNEIISMGVRIVPLNSDEVKEFGKGGNVPTNVARRVSRGARRNLQRFKLRRGLLQKTLSTLGINPDQHLLRELRPQDLFDLREKALQQALTRSELGRVFLHLNLRRGYKSSRKDQEKEQQEKKQDSYLGQIESREKELHENGQTIGQRFASGLQNDQNYRVRQQIFNRDTYQDEFDRIWMAQAIFHPEILTDANRRLIRDRIIYRQRPLRSQKSLVGECALDWQYALDKQQQRIIQPNGLPKIVRPKCAPKSSPLAQECRIWENIHNLRITDERGDNYALNNTQKQQIFDTLQQKDKLSATALLKLIGNLSPKAYSLDELVKEKGLEGNKTRTKLCSVFDQLHIQHRDLLIFNPAIDTVQWEDPETNEQISRQQIRGDFDQQPLYKLWHLLYATEEETDLVRILQERYGFTPEQAKGLAKIDFTAAGFSNKSSRAMRRLLPHLQRGDDYTNACKAAGYNHSNSITKAENEARTLLQKLDILPGNSLRNPVVEKILNQMVNLINDLICPDTGFGRPDEIRVELARELKQSAKERQGATQRNGQRERDNKRIRMLVSEELNIQPESVTKGQIEKWKLYEEVGGVSLYTGNPIERASFLRAEGIDVEHIIPKVRRFDDSFENKTLCERRLNQDKNKDTARDFMEGQSVAGLQNYDAYLRRIKDLLDQKKISKAKYARLMMTAEDLSQDTEFLARQLRETQYITKKAKEMLLDVCHHVYTSSGSVTDFLRHQWGWDETIEQLRLPQFREAELTKTIQIRKGQQSKEVIPDWTKRLDHRHHALDALTVACTRQSHIQRLNTLNQTLDGKFGQDRRGALLAQGRDKYLAGSAPFSHAEVCTALDAIFISYKNGVKVATRSKNNPKGSKKEPQITLTPRGSLHEETVYGRIKHYIKVPVNSRFDLVMLSEMVHPHQRALLEARLAAYGNDPKKAFKDLEKNPIVYGKHNDKHLKQVTVWDYFYVSRKSVGPLLTEKQVGKVADRGVRRILQDRLIVSGGTSKEAFKNVGNEPIRIGQNPVQRIRVLNPAEKMIQLPRGFVEPGSNHHIAIYIDATGKKHEHVVTFWDAFQRLRVGLPAIISDVSGALEMISQYPGDLPDLYLPSSPDWQLVTSMAINDMFVFGLDPKEINFQDDRHRSLVSRHLFRIRKLTSGNYWFMHHLETQILEDTTAKKMQRCKQCSISSLQGAVKVRIDRLGRIIQVG